MYDATTTRAVTPAKAPVVSLTSRRTRSAHDVSGSTGSIIAAARGSATVRVVTVKASNPRTYCRATTSRPSVTPFAVVDLAATAVHLCT